MKLRIVPLTLEEANALVTMWHRHHPAAVGHRLSIGVVGEDGELHGAAVIGRPVARVVDARSVAEVTRLVTDGTPNACSMLYAAAARACTALGFETIQTYILEAETGTSLRASGWEPDGLTRTGSAARWSRDQRPRDPAHPQTQKQRWIRRLNEARPPVRTPVRDQDGTSLTLW